MGRARAQVEFYVAVIKPHEMRWKVTSVPVRIAKEAFRLADAKLPFHCRFIVRGHRPLRQGKKTAP